MSFVNDMLSYEKKVATAVYVRHTLHLRGATLSSNAAMAQTVCACPCLVGPLSSCFKKTVDARISMISKICNVHVFLFWALHVKRGVGMRRRL